MISLGNLFFTNLHSFPSSGSHATLSTLHKYDTLLKDSYKFYHHAITATKTQASSQSVGVHTNAFAAQGLGMVLAEKGYLDVARDIFSRMRESDMGHCKVQTNMIMDSENISLVGTPGVTMTAPSTSTVPSNGKLTMTVDVCCNLAHINLVQGRVLDAIYMYQTALKACMVVGSTQVVIKDGDAKGKTHIYQLINTSSVKSILSVISISECLALAFLKNNEYDNALQTLCKALWYADPGVATSTMASNSTLAAANASLIQTYYNIAYICEEHGLYVLFKKNGGNNVMNATVADVKTAIREFNAACRYYGALAALPRDSTNPATSYSSAYVKYIFNGAHSKRLALDQKQSLAHHAYCFENVENATKLLNRARLEEEKLLDKNLLLEAETSSRLQEKQQKMNAEQLAQEEKLRLIQEKAVQKRMHLEKLQENWSAAPAATAASGSNKGSKSKKSKELDRSIYDSDEDDNAIQQKAREIKKKEQAQVAEAEIESESESDIGDVGDSSSDEGEYSAGSDHDSDNDGGAIQGLDAKKQRKEERKRLRKAERKEKRRQEKKLLKAQKRDKNVDSIDATLNTQENPNKKRRLLPKNAGQSDDEMETDVVSNTTSEHASIDPATTKKRSILDDSDDDEDALF